MSRETARHDVSVPLEGLSLDPSRTETRHFRIRDVSVSRLALGHPRTPLPAGLRATSGPQGHRAGLTVSVPAGPAPPAPCRAPAGVPGPAWAPAQASRGR